MNVNGTDQRSLEQAIELLRAEVARLGDRVTAVEQAAHDPRGAAPDAAANIVDSNEELVCVITAAIAAYLGVQPHLRQVRLVSGASWAQQGRVTIQASHALSIRHE